MQQPGDQRANRDIFNIDNKGTVTVVNHPLPTRPRNELLLLQQVKDEVNGRLAQSLHNAVLINLGKQVQPEQVKRPWDAEVKIGSKSAQPLTPETPILEVFQRPDIAGKLLILGDPGSGKTTTMLDLTQALVQKAEADNTAAIPVLLHLSSWKDPRVLLHDWLLADLKSKYGVRKDIATQWLQDKQLVPLLDGLDEVNPEHQESCVQAINQWLQSDFRPLSLLVCSRREEYGNYATRLDLNGAIFLQALTDGQIQDYLTSVQLPDLGQLFQQDEALLDLLHTPLLLSIAVLAFPALSLEQWPQRLDSDQRLQRLLDAYLETMLHREIRSRAYPHQKPPTAQQIRHWLIVLAKRMQQESQTEFLIEKIQPEAWLLTKKQQWVYKLIVGLTVELTLCLSIGLSGGLIFGLMHNLVYGLMVGLGIGLMVGLGIGLIVSLTSGLNRVEPVEVIQVSILREVQREVFKSLPLGLTVGLVTSLFIVLNGELMQAFVYGLSALLSSLLSRGLLVGLNNGIKGSENGVKIYPNQGIQKSATNFLLTCLIVVLTFVLIFGLISRSFLALIAGLIMGLSFGLMVGLGKGGEACISHLTLRWLLYRSDSMPWNYARFLDYCTERLLLQRIGGRYRFMHKLLQDHFVAMPLEQDSADSD